ncbi:MAG TPA: DUF1116 domain-containing protein [Gammaproteobacteria bacterium]|nr:DUF1116 domain-containing protein [Gammaproteobacteria bacterium]
MREQTHPADEEALSRILRVKPIWSGMQAAADAVNLAEDTLLHAGPAFKDPADIVKPILNSACVAAVFNGLAPNFDEAKTGIHSGKISLKSAQDHDVVTPLAAVVSSKMLLHCIEDQSDSQVRAFAPINGGNGPAPRLGICSPDALAHLSWLHQSLGPALADVCTDGIHLLDIAAQSVREGDDCHGRTPVGTRLLLGKIQSKLSRQSLGQDFIGFIEQGPSFFLNIWMAASKTILLGGQGVAKSSLITVAAANGRETGIQLAGLPGRWFTAPASPPKGDFDVNLPGSRALGAIGDSAIVDALGFGAMAMSFCPVQKTNLGHWLPPDGLATGSMLTAAVHPGFADLGLSVGITARACISADRAPLVSLGILDNLGEVGRLGGGIFEQPKSMISHGLSELTSSG